MIDQARVFFLKPTSPAEMLANENYLDDLQDTEIKIEIKTLHKNFQEFKGDTKKQLNEIKEKGLRRINTCVASKKTHT